MDEFYGPLTADQFNSQNPPDPAIAQAAINQNSPQPENPGLDAPIVSAPQDLGNNTSSQMSIEPALPVKMIGTPTVNQQIPITTDQRIQQLLDPNEHERLRSGQAAALKKAHNNDWMLFFPALAPFQQQQLQMAALGQQGAEKTIADRVALAKALREEQEFGNKNVLTQHQQEILKQQQDVDSAYSKSSREIAHALFPTGSPMHQVIDTGNNGGPMTAEQIDQYIMKRGAPAQTLATINAENARAKMMDARSREAHADALALRNAAKEEKTSKIENDLFEKAEKHLAVGNLRGGALATEAKKVNLAKHLAALATDENGQIKDLTNIGEEELGMGLATMVGGGNQQAASTFHRVVPSYAAKDLTMAKQYIMGHPEILHDKEFVQNFYDSAMRQGKVSSDAIKQAQIESLPAIEGAKLANPERYNRLLQAHDIDPTRDIDEFGRYKGGQKLKNSPSSVQTKVVNGVTYKKVPGGWQEVK